VFFVIGQKGSERFTIPTLGTPQLLLLLGRMWKSKALLKCDALWMVVAAMEMGITPGLSIWRTEECHWSQL